MDDRGNGDPAADLKAAIDRRVSEALEAEYTRERLEGRRTGSTTGRRLALAALGMVILVAVVSGVLWTQDPGSESIAAGTTMPEAAFTSTIPTADTPDIELQPSDMESLASALQSQAVLLTTLKPSPEPIGLTGDYQPMCLNGAPLHVFEYGTVAERQRESDGIASDGRITISQGEEATLRINQWVAAPRFFAQGRLIVLALGPDETTLEILTSLLGGTLSPDGQGLDEAGLCAPG